MSDHNRLQHAGGEHERFQFGANWTQFLRVLNDERIHEAECSLMQALAVDTLHGTRFLDIGSGSGLFSLAARRLGAQVHSFDYDLQSVACTQELKRRYCPDDPLWRVEQGSVLDTAYLNSLGQFDIVYAWGVLHHTGAMWQALEHVVALVADGGMLFLSIYNDQGAASRIWKGIKQLYNRTPPRWRWLILGPAFIRLHGPSMVRDLLLGRPFHTWRTYARNRGMSAWHDVLDWVGGFPFEVAQPEQVFAFYRDRGFVLQHLKTVGSKLGCNEYIFHKIALPTPS